MEEELRRREREVRLDVLVNNAGTGHFGRISETTEQKFDELFAANTKAPFLVTTHALKYLAAGGRVINISSGASRRPGQAWGEAPPGGCLLAVGAGVGRDAGWLGGMADRGSEDLGVGQGHRAVRSV